jgi:hypothetical protein
MSVYLYDGSFEGFLSVVYHSFYAKKPASKIIKDLKNISLLDEVTEIVTDKMHSQKVHDSLKKRFDKCHYNKIFNTFLCDSREFEKALYDFIVIGFKDAKKLCDINHPSIYYLEKLEREYFRYLDRMYGFIRFEELEDGSLYALKKSGIKKYLPPLEWQTSGKFIYSGLQRNIYVASDSRILIFSNHGQLLDSTGIPQSYANLGGLAVDDSGRIFLAFKDPDIVISIAGETVDTITTRGSGNLFVEEPGGMAFRNSVLYIAVPGHNWVEGWKILDTDSWIPYIVKTIIVILAKK